MMRYLLDTHIFLCAIFDKNKLSKNISDIINDSNNIIFISLASLQEIAIKASIGKLDIPENFFDRVDNSSYRILNINSKHLAALTNLPIIHRDPFDRTLVAQSISENLPLISIDPEIIKYNCEVISI